MLCICLSNSNLTTIQMLRILMLLGLCLVSATTVTHEEKMLKMAMEAEDQRKTAIRQRWLVFSVACASLSIAFCNTFCKTLFKKITASFNSRVNACCGLSDPDAPAPQASKYHAVSKADVQTTFEI